MRNVVKWPQNVTKIAVLNLCFHLQKTKITKLRMYVVTTELPGEERAPIARQLPVIPLQASKNQWTAA